MLLQLNVLLKAIQEAFNDQHYKQYLKGQKG
jgi:hypothetical protein